MAFRPLSRILAAFSLLGSIQAQEQASIAPLTEFGAANCSFAAQPDEFINREFRVRDQVQERTRQLSKARLAAAGVNTAANLDPVDVPRRNFIDDAIFGKLKDKGVQSARLTTDEEFIRRIYLDLTGRIPTPDQYRAFVADKSESKRAQLIDKLLYSREFTDKWTLWWGDLLQNAQSNSYRSVTVDARNGFYSWIAQSVSQNKSIRDTVFEVLTAKGNTNNTAQSASTWITRWQTPNGPIEDTYDTLFSRSAAAFMGVSHYDCLLCHDGRGHLEQLSLWGRRATRLEAYQMASYFSRVRFNNRSGTDAEYPSSTDIADTGTGTYSLNTTYGNRPRRSSIGSLRTATPAWKMGANEPASGDWRGMFATRLTADRMFARNFANRLWKEMFNLGLVDPVDQLDPARLDPSNPPPGDWTLQATHPELLERLADELIASNYNMREFMRRIVDSNAYQLSSEYDGEWKLENTSLFARHFVRRLEGEEIHDAMQLATNVLGRYTVGGWAEPVNWAMQLPEPVEPRSNTVVRDFMGFFLRGNRDAQNRAQDGSILQQLNLMNNNFVTSKAKVASSSVLKAVSTMSSFDAMVDELFLRFLVRQPSPSEKAKAVAFLSKAGTSQTARNTAVEDLAWALMNKQEFIFSY